MGSRNSGPKPQPNAVRILKGDKNPSRYNFDEPVPPAGEIVKPATLSAGAAAVWERDAPLVLEMGTLTAADVPTFAAYCELFAAFIWNNSQQDIEGGKFNAARQVGQANALRPYFEYFGMTPGGRARIRVKKTKAPVSKWADVA